MTRGRKPGHIIGALAGPLVAGALTLTRRGVLLLDGRSVKLTLRQGDLLAYLMRSPETPRSAAWLTSAVWGSASECDRDTMRSTIYKIRRRTGCKIIRFCRGLGYYVPAQYLSGDSQAVVERQLVSRYQAGETGRALRREYHMGWLRFRAVLDAFGVKRHGWARKDTRTKCLRCEVVLEEAATMDGPGRDGLCWDCTWLEDTGEHFCVPIERFDTIVEGVLG